MPRGDQLAPQWRLLPFLGRPPGLAVEDAARELGCTVRTVWRDLRVLQEVGFPIYDEREGRRGLWKVEVAFRDRLPVPLSLPEVVALLVSRDLASARRAAHAPDALLLAEPRRRDRSTRRSLPSDVLQRWPVPGRPLPSPPRREDLRRGAHPHRHGAARHVRDAGGLRRRGVPAWRVGHRAWGSGRRARRLLPRRGAPRARAALACQPGAARASRWPAGVADDGRRHARGAPVAARLR